MGNCKSSDVRTYVTHEPAIDPVVVIEAAMTESSESSSTQTSSSSSTTSSSTDTSARSTPVEIHPEPEIHAEPAELIIVPAVELPAPTPVMPGAQAIEREYKLIFGEPVDIDVDAQHAVLVAYRQPVPPPSTVTVANTTQRLILWDIMLELAEDFRPLRLTMDGFTFEFDMRMPMQRGIIVTVDNHRVAVIVAADTIGFIEPPSRKLVLAAAKPSLRSPRCALCSNDRDVDHLTCEVDRYREGQLQTIFAKHLGSSSTYA